MLCYDAFADEEITLECLHLMSEELLKTVIPKAGPRAVFLSKLKVVGM
jgi:hypothetical protein